MQSKSRLMIALAGFVFVFTVALSAVVVAGQQPQGDRASLAGRKVFLEKCASCHGVDARGSGHLASRLKGVPMDLTQIAVRHQGFSPYEVQQTIVGDPRARDPLAREMPHWGRVFRQEGGEALATVRTHSLVSYLESIQAR